MTKREYMRLVMRLRPSAKDWRELAEKAIRSGCIDYKSAVNYRHVYPLAAAIAESLTEWFVNGSMDESTRRRTRREARNIRYLI